MTISPSHGWNTACLMLLYKMSTLSPLTEVYRNPAKTRGKCLSLSWNVSGNVVLKRKIARSCLARPPSLCTNSSLTDWSPSECATYTRNHHFYWAKYSAGLNASQSPLEMQQGSASAIFSWEKRWFLICDGALTAGFSVTSPNSHPDLILSLVWYDCTIWQETQWSNIWYTIAGIHNATILKTTKKLQWVCRPDAITESPKLAF